MYSLPREIHQEIAGWLEPETQQIIRLTSRYWAGLIKPRDVNLLEFDATRGILEYCKIRLPRGNLKMHVFVTAVQNGYLEVLKWVCSEGFPSGVQSSSDWCSRAARYGQLETLQWLRYQDFPWDSDTCACAALYGHLEILKWARGDLDSPASRSEGINPERNENTVCPWDEWTCIWAAQNGHLEVLKWALSQGCPGDKEMICTWAAIYGHLEVLKWARSQGYPWCAWTCAGAAESGHLEILQWIRGALDSPASGRDESTVCPWDGETCHMAAWKGHLEVLQWALDNGCPWDYRDVDISGFPQNIQDYLTTRG